jgi:hypothetical protein
MRSCPLKLSAGGSGSRSIQKADACFAHCTPNFEVDYQDSLVETASLISLSTPPE